MASTMPGGSNTYVPSHEASGKLVVDFSRNVNKFKVGEYTKLVKVTKDYGLWMKMNWEENGRILSTTGSDALWRDGDESPKGRDGLKEHEWKEYRTERYARAFNLGDKGVEQATWDVVASHAAAKAQQAMTLRTLKAATLFQTSGNYPSGNVLDVGSGGAGNTGRWDVSTTARTDIKRSINAAIQAIWDRTYSAVDVEDLVLVMNDETAGKISVTQEIVDMIKQSPDALAYIKGELSSKNPNAQFGLPPKLYGVKLVIDNTRYTSNVKRATQTISRALDSDKPFLVARPQGLEGTAGGPQFAAATGFFYEEMAVETFKDKKERRVIGRVTEDYVYKATAFEAAVLFTDVLT